MSEQAVRPVRVLRVSDGIGTEADDHVAAEEPLEVRVNNAPFAVIMRTPGQDIPLTAGFLLAEDVVRTAGEIAAIECCDDVEDEARGNVLNVTVTGDAAARVHERIGERRQIITTAACGLCGRRTIESIRARISSVGGHWSVPAGVVTGLPGALRAAQSAFDRTGGIHASALCDLQGRVRFAAEDVGRHNALDKIVGRALLDGLVPLDDTLLVVSGRSSYELVQKALLAGVPLVAGVSAPSSLAVELARETRITLCGFVRDGSMNVYTHPHRIAG